MNGRHVALTAFGRGQTARAADVEGPYQQPLSSQTLDDEIESDAVTSHDHEVGHLSRPTDSLHRHGRIASDALNLSADSNEAISLAERRDGARALGDWIGSPRDVISARDDGDHKVLDTAALRHHAHG